MSKNRSGRFARLKRLHREKVEHLERVVRLRNNGERLAEERLTECKKVAESRTEEVFQLRQQLDEVETRSKWLEEEAAHLQRVIRAIGLTVEIATQSPAKLPTVVMSAGDLANGYLDNVMEDVRRRTGGAS